jgi:hypothetical protein
MSYDVTRRRCTCVCVCVCVSAVHVLTCWKQSERRLRSQHRKRVNINSCWNFRLPEATTLFELLIELKVEVLRTFTEIDYNRKSWGLLLDLSGSFYFMPLPVCDVKCWRNKNNIVSGWSL